MLLPHRPLGPAPGQWAWGASPPAVLQMTRGKQKTAGAMLQSGTRADGTDMPLY